jgi:hypothetical protein
LAAPGYVLGCSGCGRCIRYELLLRHAVCRICVAIST